LAISDLWYMRRERRRAWRVFSVAVLLSSVNECSYYIN
jgi:hypothetical protein